MLEAKQGKKLKFEEFYTSNFKKIYFFFLRNGFSCDDAGDLTQETFLKLLTTPENYKGECSYSSWLFAIAKNKLRNNIRDRKRQKRCGVEVQFEAESPELFANSAYVTTEERLSQRDEIKRSMEVIDSFPEQMKKAMALRVLNGMKYKEIASILNTDIDSIKTQLFLARKRLKMAKYSDY